MVDRTRKSFIESTGIVTLGHVAALASAVVVGSNEEFDRQAYHDFINCSASMVAAIDSAGRA